MGPIRSMRELVERAAAVGPCRLAVPGAGSESALEAAVEARRAGVGTALLLGDRDALHAALRAHDEDPAAWAVEHEPDPVRSARRAVALVRAGEAQVILKGQVTTADLLRAVLDRHQGLRGEGLISDVMVSEAPRDGPRLLAMSDGGVNVAPSLDEKRAILRNALRVLRRLGLERPRVALLCAVEVVTPAMPHTGEAAALAEAAARGELGPCEVVGPIALDGALSVEAARAKGIDHPAAGRADLLLVPTIEVGNALGKAFTWLADRPVAHVLEGARAPVLIPSRAERSFDKLCSVALGALAARGDA